MISTRYNNLKTKVCNTCGVEKPLSKNYFTQRKWTTSKGKKRTGFQHECKECGTLRRKIALRKRVAKERVDHADRRTRPNYRRVRNKYLIRMYGITLEEYEALVKKQSGCCAICGVHEDTLTNALNVDHDHRTGKIRGLLCWNCNNTLTHRVDNCEWLEAATRYICGVTLNEADS